MKIMQSSLDFIQSKITYNEILNIDIFEYGAFTNYKDSIIQLSDGSLMLSFCIETGDSNLSFEIAERRKNILVPFFANLENSFEINFEIRRKKSGFEYLSFASCTTGSIKEIEKRRESEFLSKNNLINEIYISLIYRNLDKNFSLTPQTLNMLVNKAEELKNSLSASGCSCLLLKSDKLVSFLKYAYDFNKDKIKKFNTNTTLSSSMLNAIYRLKNIPLVIENTDKIYVNCLSFSSLPSESEVDMFSFLFSLPFEFRAVFKYKAYDREKSKNLVFHKKKSYKNSLFSLTSYMKKEVTGSDISDEYNHDALSGKAQCDTVLDLLSKEFTSTGDVQITFVLFNSDLEILEKTISEFKSIMQKQGFIVKRETIGNSLCFISTLPANSYYYNPIMLLSNNFCDFLHLTSSWQGAKNCKLLSKRVSSQAPLIYAKNLDTSPFYFSLSGEEGEKGHSFITGPTGSGKSALLSLIAASFLKYSNTRCVIIDRDLSSLELVNDNKGKIFYPGFDKTCFNVLSNVKANPRKIFEFMKAICFVSNIPYSADMQKVITNAIQLLDEHPITLSRFYSILKGINKDLPALVALQAYVKGGEHEGLFDAEADNFDINNRITLVETNKIFQNSTDEKNISVVFFTYLFLRLDELFDNCTPTVLIIDEGWKVLKNKTFSAFFEEWIKTLRKKNVDIVFSCTNLSDIIDTQIAETIISNVETKIFFKDINAENEIQKSNYKKVGLSDYEISLIKQTPQFCPLVMQNNKLSLVDFRMQNILNFITTSAEKKRRFMCEN